MRTGNALVKRVAPENKWQAQAEELIIRNVIGDRMELIIDGDTSDDSLAIGTCNIVDDPLAKE
jgi:hypothetical protein